VYQVLKRHFARYTEDVVQEICGIPRESFRKVAEALVANSGRERTSALVYSVGWTQHSVGVQYIRTGAILQTLLGNIGRPGGGILALRGHASIQGSTCCRATSRCRTRTSTRRWTTSSPLTPARGASGGT
jgi:formate dehydrogenase major subunit